MLIKKQIIALFAELEAELEKAGQIGEIGIVGGAVMCLVYDARAATRDIDAIFVPSVLLRKIAQDIASRHGLPSDWLNDGAKAFLSPEITKVLIIDHPYLKVWAPDARYMLAMKCLSARWDSHDKDDVLFLIRHLAYRSSEQVFSLIEQYFPKQAIPAKTQFFVEEQFPPAK